MKGYAAVVPAMTQPIDSSVAAAYTEVMANCTVNGANPCVNGTYHNSSNPALVWQQYMQGLYTNTTGFSENSFYISQAGGKQPSYIAPMLLSYRGVNNPLAYTDGLVINNSSCTGQCVQDVYAFATFYNSPAIRNYICFSQDAPGVPPRRLSPAIASFWSQQVVSSDPWYTQFKSGFGMAQAFPNQGMQAARGSLETQLCTYMKANGIPDACKN
jgi:thiamine pyridinylase